MKNLPSSELEPGDRVRIRFLDNKLDGYSPDGVLTRDQNHGIAADGPAVAENFDHVVSKLRRWFRAHRHVYRATGMYHDPILCRALARIRHYRPVHFYIQVLIRPRIYQPWMLLTIFLETRSIKYNNVIQLFTNFLNSQDQRDLVNSS